MKKEYEKRDKPRYPQNEKKIYNYIHSKYILVYKIHMQIYG